MCEKNALSGRGAFDRCFHRFVKCFSDTILSFSFTNLRMLNKPTSKRDQMFFLFSLLRCVRNSVTHDGVDDLQTLSGNCL